MEGIAGSTLLSGSRQECGNKGEDGPTEEVLWLWAVLVNVPPRPTHYRLDPHGDYWEVVAPLEGEGQGEVLRSLGCAIGK